MRRQSIVFGLIAALAAASAVAKSAQPDAVYIAGSSYTAVLDQQAQRWTLLPLDGQDFEVTSNAKSCASDTTIASGLWLVGRDADGNPELVAPSATDVAGGSERIALHACGEAGEGLAAPRPLIEWLSDNSGAVLVED